MAGPARGRPTSRPQPSVSEVHPSAPPVEARGRRAGGAGRRREGAQATRPEHELTRGLRVPSRRPRTGLVNGGRTVRETDRKQVRCLTGTSSGSIDRRRRRTVGSRPHGRIQRPGENAWPGARISRMEGARVRPDLLRPREHRTHGMLEKALEGTKAQESTDRWIAPWPGPRSESENGLSRRAKLRSGRAGCRVRRARPIRDETSQTTTAT